MNKMNTKITTASPSPIGESDAGNHPVPKFIFKEKVDEPT